MKTKNQRSTPFSTLALIPITIILLVAYSIKAGDKVNPEKQKAISELIINDDEPILITKSDLVNAKGVYFSADDAEFASAFRVVSFTVSTRIGDYEESYTQNNGPSFTSKQIKLIRRVKAKAKVYIENIKAIGPEGEIRNLGSITFKIKG